MKYAQQLLQGIRKRVGSHEHWEGKPPHLNQLPQQQWRIYCGEGRFEPSKRNALYSLATGIALNFQIRGKGESITDFEMCVAWPPFEASFWQLMFHLDPERQAWPRHPLHHIQFTCGAGLPPFSSWRLPFGETQPERLLEFIAAHLSC
ncbi:hypothetical protein [Archangium sp.]|uniref:hypothetical protein n=1 Tax=Archangium sp. TaxID=1872627 RepID=UPI002D666D5F|nr:hypothetical protein [Archangium sp.]HYO51186.1 hypothetical protein [Archangium sp.]